VRLIKFAGIDGSYTFPPQTSGQDNFGNLVTKTTRLPGVDGGYDEDQSRRAVQAIGNVDASWWLNYNPASPDPLEHAPMWQQRDLVGQLAGWHKSRLFMAMHESARQDKRWTWARLNNYRMPENVKTLPHNQIQVQAAFQVNDPGWRGGQRLAYTDEGHIADDGWITGGALYLDEGHTCDNGLYVMEPKLDAQMLTSGTTYTVSNRGNRDALARLEISATENEWEFGGTLHLGDGHYFGGGVAPVSNINVKFSANGKLTTQWAWGDTLQPGEFLIVDAETQSVKVRGRTDRSGYTAFQRQRGYGFIHVPPGDSTLQVIAGIGPRGCRITLDFQDTFYNS
jgi:hypothetical protein